METQTAEQDFEAGLQALIDGQSSGAPAPAQAGVAAVTPASAQPAPAASPAPVAEVPEVDPRVKALDEIDTGEKPEDKKEPAVGTLTADQEAVFKAVPTVAVAEKLYAIANQYEAVTNVLEAKDFAGFETMLDKWNPAIKSAMIEHFYQTQIKVKDSPLLERFIAEAEGRGPQHTAITSVQEEVKALKAELAREKAVKAGQQAQTAQQQTFKAYTDTITGLVEKYAPEGDREFILNTIHTKVAQDPKLRAAIEGGDLRQARVVAKDVMTKYFTRDKATKSAEAEKIAVQSQKKIPLGGAAGAIEGSLPDDINKVPKDQRENYLDQGLAKLKHMFGK